MQFERLDKVNTRGDLKTCLERFAHAEISG